MCLLRAAPVGTCLEVHTVHSQVGKSPVMPWQGTIQVLKEEGHPWPKLLLLSVEYPEIVATVSFQ